MKCCPLCRKEEYQKAMISEGKKVYLNKCATKYDSPIPFKFKKKKEKKREASLGFEPRLVDSESTVLTVRRQGHFFVSKKVNLATTSKYQNEKKE